MSTALCVVADRVEELQTSCLFLCPCRTTAAATGAAADTVADTVDLQDMVVGALLDMAAEALVLADLHPHLLALLLVRILSE